ncbi:MAG TPA: SAM-dependent methyltransferase, partial [Clostridiales bacterium]|nr:SAM-dependent methyltransferase [Clostridiales bacterium]
FLAQLDTKKYNVLKLDYLNRTNDPPIPILIEKNE